ncbi:3390_t:CDS:2 [Ambispora gerdemannii]|uniref:3390_t:CDS:1 n=1 Tax=Ambispora gerdemannii TaxID=144530 RepID=A0A9N9B8N7_9GLOM|nr:3390_t:CDS:2 [Ambispora gerdemannii]
MKRHFNGYRFSPSATSPHVLNTNNCLEYLQMSADAAGRPIKSCQPSNSEASERVLQVLAASPITISIPTIIQHQMLNAWRVPIPCETLQNEFRLSDLHMDITKSRPVWLSYMFHVGCLSFTDEMTEKQLQIPNLVAAQRFANAVLDRFELRASDIMDALQKIVSIEDISDLLGFYQRMMSKRDVSDNDLRDKLEEHHRDSFTFADKTGSPNSIGRIDLLIKTNTSRITITKCKALRINFLDIQPAASQPGPKRSVDFRKALTLSNISDVASVLKFKLASYDRFGRAGKTIREWIFEMGGPNEQWSSIGPITVLDYELDMTSYDLI